MRWNHKYQQPTHLSKLGDRFCSCEGRHQTSTTILYIVSYSPLIISLPQDHGIQHHCGGFGYYLWPERPFTPRLNKFKDLFTPTESHCNTQAHPVSEWSRKTKLKLLLPIDCILNFCSKVLLSLSLWNIYRIYANTHHLHDGALKCQAPSDLKVLMVLFHPSSILYSQNQPTHQLYLYSALKQP